MIREHHRIEIAKFISEHLEKPVEKEVVGNILDILDGLMEKTLVVPEDTWRCILKGIRGDEANI